MTAPVPPTLGELAYRVAVRVGYGAQGGASAVQRPIIEDFVRSAQSQLIEQYHDTLLRVINDYDPGTLSVGQTLYDIPDDARPDDFEEIRLLTVEGDAAYPPLVRGITHGHRAYTDRRRPERYEIRLGTTDQPQLELWPEPDDQYPIRMEYFLRQRDFRDDSDKATINGELIFLHALATAKAHYRHPDAEAISQQLNAMLSKLKARQHKGRRYVRRGFTTGDNDFQSMPPPKRV